MASTAMAVKHGLFPPATRTSRYRLGRFNVRLDTAFQQFPKNRELMLVAEQLGQEHRRLSDVPGAEPLGIFVKALNARKAGAK